jgi:hypothetical protein
MEKIELEFDSKLTNTEQVLGKVSQVVKYAEEQGLHLRELELESEETIKKKTTNSRLFSSLNLCSKTTFCVISSLL